MNNQPLRVSKDQPGSLIRHPKTKEKSKEKPKVVL